MVTQQSYDELVAQCSEYTMKIKKLETSLAAQKTQARVEQKKLVSLLKKRMEDSKNDLMNKHEKDLNEKISSLEISHQKTMDMKLSTLNQRSREDASEIESYKAKLGTMSQAISMLKKSKIKAADSAELIINQLRSEVQELQNASRKASLVSSHDENDLTQRIALLESSLESTSELLAQSQSEHDTCRQHSLSVEQESNLLKQTENQLQEQIGVLENRLNISSKALKDSEAQQTQMEDNKNYEVSMLRAELNNLQMTLTECRNTLGERGVVDVSQQECQARLHTLLETLQSLDDEESTISSLHPKYFFEDFEALRIELSEAEYREHNLISETKRLQLQLCALQLKADDDDDVINEYIISQIASSMIDVVESERRNAIPKQQQQESTQFDEMTQKNQQLEQQCEMLEQEIKDLKASNSASSTHKEDMLMQLQAQKKAYAVAQQEITQLKLLNDESQTKNDTSDELKNTIIELTNAKKSALNTLQMKEHESTELQKRLTTLQHELDSTNVLAGQAESLREQVFALENNEKKLHISMNKLEQKCSDLRAQLAKLHTNKQSSMESYSTSDESNKDCIQQQIAQHNLQTSYNSEYIERSEFTIHLKAIHEKILQLEVQQQILIEQHVDMNQHIAILTGRDKVCEDLAVELHKLTLKLSCSQKQHYNLQTSYECFHLQRGDVISERFAAEPMKNEAQTSTSTECIAAVKLQATTALALDKEKEIDELRRKLTAMNMTISKLKKVLKEVQALEKSVEKKWLEEKKRVMKLTAALKQSDKNHSAVKKVDELESIAATRSLELDMLKKNFEQCSTQMNQLEQEKAQALLLLDETKERAERLATCVDTHWLLSSPEVIDYCFQVEQRVKIDNQWWYFIAVQKRKDDSESTEFITVFQRFWTPAEVFEVNANIAVFKGDVSDSQKAQNNAKCELLSGVSLPDSVTLAAELTLKIKFDKRWSAAAKKFESKVNGMENQLIDVQTQLKNVQHEYLQYKQRAHQVLKEKAEEIERFEAQCELHEALQKKFSDMQRQEENMKSDVESALHSRQRLEHLSQEIAVLTDDKSRLEEELYHAQKSRETEAERAEHCIQQGEKRRQSLEAHLHSQSQASLSAMREEFQRQRETAAKMLQDRDEEIQRLRVSSAEIQSESYIQPIAVSQPATSVASSTSNTQLESIDESEHVRRLQKLLQDSETAQFDKMARLHELEKQARDAQRSTHRGNADMDYLKHCIVKYIETEEKETLLPVIAKILDFDDDEVARTNTALRASQKYFSKMW